MARRLFVLLAFFVVLSPFVLNAQQGARPAPAAAGGYLGVQTEDLNAEKRADLGLKESEGVLVVNVMPDTPAEKAGIKSGDVILKVGETAVGTREQLVAALGAHKAGAKVKIATISGGEREEVEVTLAERPAASGNPYGAVQSLHQEYGKRAKAIGEKDVKARLKLAKWCEEKGILFDARLEYEKILTIDKDHAEARKALCWVKNKKGEWELDFMPFAKTIKYIDDAAATEKFKGDKGYKTMTEYIKNPATWASMAKRIYERVGLYRLPGELDITVRFSTNMPKQAAGVTKSLGFIGSKNAYRATIDLQTDKMKSACRNGSVRQLDTVTVHELAHALTTPAMTRWQRWLAEGMAAYIAHEEDKVRSIEKAIPDLDQPIKEYFQNYGRGFVFMRYIEFEGGMERVKDFVNRVVVNRENPKSAAEAVMNKTWDVLKPEEFKFAKEYVDDFSKKFGRPPAGAPMLGVTFGWEGDEGVEVIAVAPGLGSEKAGLKEGDFVTHIDKKEMKTMMDVREHIWKKKPGDVVEVTIDRDDKPVHLKVTLTGASGPAKSPPPKKP